MLPGGVRDAAITEDHCVPTYVAEVVVWRDAVFCDQKAVGDVIEREVRNRVAARLVQQQHTLTVGDPLLAESDPHPPAQRLGEQQVFGHRLCRQEASHRTHGQRTLLPCQSHCGVPSLVCYAATAVTRCRNPRIRSAT